MADSLRRPQRSDLRAVAGAALLAVAYTLAISLASAISAPAVTIAPIRPPNAIALAVFLLVSPADWWLYLIGLCAANVFGAATIGRGLWYALANGTEVLGAAFLLRRVTRRSPRLDTLEECLLFVAIAGVIAPIAGATLGSPAVARLSPTVETLVAWRTWFLGDAVANITIAPALLGVYALVRSGGGAAKPARVAEATALGLSLLAASLPTLGLTGSIPGLRAASLSLLYVPFPLLVWAAIRFGPCGAAFSNLLLTALAVTSALRDSGPFSRLANPDGVIVLQQFLAIAGATALTLAGLMADRRRATAALAASEAEQLQTAQSAATSRALLASVINSTDELVWLIEPRTHRLTLFNAAFAAYFRTHYQVALEPGMKLDDVLEPDRAATWHGLYDRALTEGPFTIEYSTDRGHLILLLSFSPVSDHGRVSGVS
ncbi:MAG TPA: MASE1 domain-containing protein, partial [Vicinamibacterales bacterium]|nr:MASE1 domain-containing protein [Vicinamibacterales bacterium]